jgi:hypothetical protein
MRIASGLSGAAAGQLTLIASNAGRFSAILVRYLRIAGKSLGCFGLDLVSWSLIGFPLRSEPYRAL